MTKIIALLLVILYISGCVLTIDFPKDKPKPREEVTTEEVVGGNDT